MEAIQSFLTDQPWAYWSLLLVGFLAVGWSLTRWLKDERVWIILLTAGLGLLFMLPPREKLKLGIDLSGGTILVYQIDTAKTSSAFGQAQMAQMVAALSKRINPAGTLDITIRPMGGDRIEIILPAADPQEVQSVQDRITKMGQLEFRILANEKHDGELGNNAIRQAREKLTEDSDINLELGLQHYQWVKVHDPDNFDVLGQTPGESVAVQDGYVLTIIPDDMMKATGDELTKVESGIDRQFRPCVNFKFDTVGTRRFAKLTRQYRPEGDEFRYKLAIILDARVMSAPVINQPIEGGEGVIEGNFDQAEVDDLIAILNAGKLPAMLIPTPISKDTVTATLGEDTIRQGTRAIFVAMIVVPVFMLAYYLFSGVVANIALLLNLILILGSMGFSQSTFTLPGLAGLALTIGMAVDANVLIFERMREERERGSGLRQAIRNGFDRAWLAIFDSNLTTIITALILYSLGTDQVKGFALTLMIGLVINLFTAVFVGRVIFDIWERHGWIKQLKMLHLIKTPNFDYVSPRHYFIAASAIVIAIGLLVTGLRGKELLDIDFTGGTAISVRLTDTTLGPDYVRHEAESAGLPNVKVERLIPEGATEEESLFLLRTTLQDQNEVRQLVTQRFLHDLNKLATVQIVKWEVESAKPAEATTKDPNSENADNEKASDDTQPSLAGASKIRLELNRQVGRDALAAKVEQTLAAENLSDPRLHYTLRPAELEAQSGKKFILETTRDPQSLQPKLAASLAADPIFERENNFKSQVASETRWKAMGAMGLSWAAIVGYLWFRFKNISYGFAAVVALVHDVLIALTAVAVGGWLGSVAPGFASLLLIDDFKIDLTVVTAFMTIIGFSVNDTIVIFDRIREIKGKAPYVTADMINQSVNQCMSRTILTALTVIVVLGILFIFGGPGVHGFSYAMLIGCLSGTYSTIFIAAPILIVFAGKPAAAASAKSVQFQGAPARA
jgi:SecD/SecF fusion protein